MSPKHATQTFLYLFPQELFLNLCFKQFFSRGPADVVKLVETCAYEW